nr:type II secretion system protein GspJ [uncultured Sphingomonas sp.]
MKPAPAERGFTLVEMIVALLIFALLAGAGVAILRASVDTQDAVSERLAELGAAARLRNLLQADLAQAVVRPIAGAPTGFAGDPKSVLLVRSIEKADRQPGSTGLQVVRWTIGQNGLARETVGTDGAVLGEPVALAPDVQSVDFRFRAADGRWSQAWSGAPALPAAVELRLQRQGEAPVTLVVGLPQGPAEPAPPATAGSAA